MFGRRPTETENRARKVGGKGATQHSLVPRLVHAIRVTRGGLEPSAIGEFSSLTGDVTSEITEDDWERGRARQKFEPRVEKLFSSPVLENFRRSFSPGPTDCPGFPRMDLKRSRQNKIKRCLLLFCFIF